MPVYVDSPMALEALNFYSARPDELDAEMRPARSRRADVRDDALHRDRVAAGVEGSSPRRSGPSIVISSSGMATGGRVLHHLADGAARPRNTVLFVGFQAAGTRGRQLVDGATDGQDPRPGRSR